MWKTPPDLMRDEAIVESWWANRAVARDQVVGGRLWLTTHRLVFVPRGIAHLVGQAPLVIPRHTIVDAERTRVSFRARKAGGTRPRLRVVWKRLDGPAEEVFVVNKLDHVIAMIRGGE